MNYETITLEITVREARKLISARNLKLRTKTSNTGVEYYSHSGLHLATLSSVTSSGPEKTKLRYRTSAVGSHHVQARTTAKLIRKAVEEYRVGSI